MGDMAAVHLRPHASQSPMYDMEKNGSRFVSKCSILPRRPLPPSRSFAQFLASKHTSTSGTAEHVASAGTGRGKNLDLTQNVGLDQSEILKSKAQQSTQ